MRRAVALLIIAWLVASAILQLPPVSWLPAYTDEDTPTTGTIAQVKPFPEKPPFRFGSRALAGVCNEYGLDAEAVVLEMKAFAIKAKPEWSIKRIAAENDMEQAALFEVIRIVATVR